MIRIVTDGAADMPPAWEKEFDIQVIPINIQFGDKTYLQYVDLDTAGFYRKVDETKTIPQDLAALTAPIRGVLQKGGSAWRYDPVDPHHRKSV